MIYFSRRKKYNMLRGLLVRLLLTYILKWRAAKCVPHMRMYIHEWIMRLCECVHMQRGKVNARRSVFTVTQARRDYVCSVNKTYKYEDRLPDRLRVVSWTIRGTWGSFRLLFSVVITEANSGKHFIMFPERIYHTTYSLHYEFLSWDYFRF